ncbi:DUF2955 domain-containing protein [Sphingomonas sp. G124]|uniref:DUF2955 domain-containing protein n=1 Tax=Sphingomonas cremea TaxID=2904799 RepID=A0A9X1QK66_9SPHN|nr:DUF2955 domain-containing protein [Sphingomonas cremea]MCF2515218.1 DUF2955 domain-containing protein [Sphingomonas cremea]
MSQAIALSGMAGSPIDMARIQAILRFGVGVTIAFVLSEAMGWAPTMLAPVLFAVLAANLPFCPPIKLGLALVAVMGGSALIAFILPSLLSEAPQVLAGALGLIVFMAFTAMARGRAKLQATFLLLCISTIPVIAIIAPAQAGVMPLAMVRGMTVAVITLWCMYALWPKVAPRGAPPGASSTDSPVKTALVGTAVVMPVMLVYLLLGLANALPVLVTTVLLVANFDPRQGAMQGLAMMIGNLIGGLIGLVAYILLAVMPSLITLGLVTFLIAVAFAIRIEKGGPGAAIALMTCNSALIILSTAIANPSSSSGVWITRLLQFALACTFAVGMMILVWSKKPQSATAAATR